MFPVRPYIAKLTQHFGKVGSTDFVKVCKKDAFSS